MMPDRRSALPIVAMAKAFDEDRKKAYQAGRNGYLSKPIDVKAVFASQT